MAEAPGAVHPITEELIIWILDPARAQVLMEEIVHVLEDRKPSHQARRQRRLSGLVGIDRAEPLVEKTPLDRPAELGERVAQVDDLVEPEPSNHPPPSRRRDRITTKRADQFARKQAGRR
jgi:hypothetical protein